MPTFAVAKPSQSRAADIRSGERATKRLRGVGAIGRDGETLTITSSRLRTGRKQRGTSNYDFDPEQIVRFCDAVFAKLVTLDDVPTITAVRAYPRAR